MHFSTDKHDCELPIFYIGYAYRYIAQTVIQVSGMSKTRRLMPTDLAGPPYRIRTCDHRNRNPVLYPTELKAVTRRLTNYNTNYGYCK